MGWFVALDLLWGVAMGILGMLWACCYGYVAIGNRPLHVRQQRVDEVPLRLILSFWVITEKRSQFFWCMGTLRHYAKMKELRAFFGVTKADARNSCIVTIMQRVRI